jgi:type IV pilus assembly protein PilQ
MKSNLLMGNKAMTAAITLLPLLCVMTRAQGQGGNVPRPTINTPTGNGFDVSSSSQGNVQGNAAGSVGPLNAGVSADGGSAALAESNLVSLEYRNAPLVEVIRSLAEGANISITFTAEVEKSSPVTIRLNKVTYEQALKAILDTYKFGSVLDNGILKIDTLANLNALREEKLKEKESAWKLQPTKRLVWQVNHAKATELQTILDSSLKSYKIDPRFSIVPDKRTNKLIIEGINDALIEAKAILENLDRRKQDVLIEARIVEASNELSKTLSVTWGTRFGFDGSRGLANGLLFPNSFGGSMGGAGALGGSAPGPGLATSPTQLGTLQFSTGSINNLINIDAILRAYETESLANVISQPRVVVQDQEKALIKEDVTLSRPVLGPDGKPEGRNTVAAIELNVTPQITSDNTIELDIQVQRQTPTNAPTDPVQGTIKRQANTKLVVGNGETAVIGGLYQTQKFKGQARVPFLGRLPLIGALFRTNEEQSFRSELMVLITPRIMPGGQSYSSSRANLPVLNGSAPSNNFSNRSGRVENTGNKAARANNSMNSSSINVKTPAAANALNSGAKVNAVNGATDNQLGNPNDFGSNFSNANVKANSENGQTQDNASVNGLNAENNLGGESTGAENQSTQNSEPQFNEASQDSSNSQSQSGNNLNNLNSQGGGEF